MIPLKGLEDWAREILATPISRLNRQFGSWKKAEEIGKSIDNLPFFTPYRPIFRTISEPILCELHQKLRGQKCEPWIWSALLKLLGHSLPDEIVFDFIERFEPNSHFIVSLGHSRQSEIVMWKLAPLVDEALLTLAKNFYGDANSPLQKFEEVLRRFPSHRWMLESLGHCAASTLEKRRTYEKAIENHSERELWIDINPRIEPNQKRLFAPLDLNRLGPDERMKALYGRYNAQKILNFARDDATPDEILRELEDLSGFPNAKEIRIAARANLRRREE